MSISLIIDHRFLWYIGYPFTQINRFRTSYIHYSTKKGKNAILFPTIFVYFYSMDNCRFASYLVGLAASTFAMRVLPSSAINCTAYGRDSLSKRTRKLSAS